MTYFKRLISPTRVVVGAAAVMAVAVTALEMARSTVPGPQPIAHGFMAFLATWMLLDGAALAAGGVHNLIVHKRDLPLLSTELFRLVWGAVFLGIGGLLAHGLVQRLSRSELGP